MREAFIQALRDNPTDAVTHAAYADWLEENGFDDEAGVQRAWTLAKHQAAEEFMREYAEALSGHGDVDEDEQAYREVTPEMVMEQADAELAKPFGGRIGLGFQTPEMVWSKREEFWKHYSVLTGRPIEDGFGATFVSCGC